uniref:HDC13754 n=1 Tax=Drosophila melanogaster TaxID=7227 RepID=Q6IK13_DROME|nr:TPA_inf: HDC13754 [Drosophila melanogaster]
MRQEGFRLNRIVKISLGPLSRPDMSFHWPPPPPPIFGTGSVFSSVDQGILGDFRISTTSSSVQGTWHIQRLTL